jgi:nitrogen regulatory protein PII
MYMVMFVLDDPGRLDELLAAWTEAGITGATIIESTGVHRRRAQTVHMRFLYQAATKLVEEGHLTLFAIVANEEKVQVCLRATEALVGDLSEPKTGIFAAWPLAVVKGLPKNYPQQAG